MRDESEIELFVMVHDQDLLLECESDGRFEPIARRRYVFLGPRPVDKLTGRTDVIVARDLADNMEEHANLLSFTGWYAVARNHLATGRYISLLEYDVALAPNFIEETLAALGEQDDLVGYVSFPLSHPMYLHATPWLIPTLAEVYEIDAVRLIDEHLASGGLDRWTATTNASMSAATLAAVVDWIVPLTVVYRHDPIGAHVHERLLKIFGLLNDQPGRYLPSLLTHAQKRSHQIFAHSWEEARQRAPATGRRGPE